MAEFLVELYVPSDQLPAVPGWEEAASTAAADVSREGAAVRYVRSIVVPEDETCFLLYDAPSIDLVRSAAERAGLGAGRITETLNQAAFLAQPAGLESPGRQGRRRVR
jgi:hypothetical protein